MGLRDHKRKARGDLHRKASVPALYIPVPGATPLPCTVRTWLRSDELTGNADVDGSAQLANPEDRIRFSLAEIPLLRARTGVVSVEAGEAYRIDHLYPADLGYQTARVTRLTPAEAAALPLPADAPQAEGGTPVEGIYVYRGAYTHEQSVAAATWTITHNLGFRPVISVTDADGAILDGQVNHVSDNVAEIDFTMSVSGEARCV